MLDVCNASLLAQAVIPFCSYLSSQSESKCWGKKKKKDVQTFLQESYDRKYEIMNSIEEGDTGCLFLPLILKSQFDLQVSCWSMQLDTYLC